LLGGVGHPPAQRKIFGIFGIFGVRDRTSGSPARASGLCRRIVRVIVPAGSWGCNSKSEQLLPSGSGLPASGESGTIVRVRGHYPLGTPGCSPDLPRQHLLLPGGIPCPGAAGPITRTIVCLPDGPARGTAR